MNYETQKQFCGFNFRCPFCGYDSKLDLKECPGCGRLTRDEKHNYGEPEFKSRRRVNGVVSESFANALPIAESYVYVCEFCCYQAIRALAECPDCGRRKFSKFDVSASRGGADFRGKWTSADKSGVGIFLLITSITFFVAAFLELLDFGIVGSNRRGAIGDNWLIILIFVVLGIGCVIAGVILKNKD